MKPGDRVVDRYVIESELGRGGMGEVFEALDTRLARKVALKLVLSHSDATTIQRTLREARAAAAFQHPNAVVVYDVGETEDAMFIAMELVRGKTLRRFVADAEIPIGRKIRWLVDIAAALAAAHDAGLVHRDVKPDNVLIRDDGAVKVLDFGIARRPAKAVDPSAPTEADAVPTITERGMVVGTPLYASPEQLRGESVDARSDQFSWAVVAYELMSGKVPWRGGGDVLVILSQVLTAEPAPLGDDVPVELRAAISKALSKNAADRFSDMRAASEAIEAFASAPAATRHSTSSESSTKAATPPPTQVARLARRTGKIVYAVFAVIGGLLVAAIIAGAIFGTVKWDPGSKAASSAAAAPAGDVVSLGCREADVEGDDATPLMKRAIGFGACARLAIELDVDWLLEGGQSPATVKAKIGSGGSDVTLTVAGKSASAHGATPVDAINVATAELAKQIKAAPPSPDRIKAWGAKDGASAVRIERVWRRIVLSLVPNHMLAIRELLKSDPDSPWPHAFAALTFERGSAEQQAEHKKALELVDRLPPSRAKGLRGILEIVGAAEGHRTGMVLLRSSYDEVPSDADIAGLFAAAAISLGNEEGFSVLDRLVVSAPTKSIVPLQNAIVGAPDRDLDRDERYMQKLTAILPEAEGAYISVALLAQRGKVDEAKKALVFADRFGLTAGDAAEIVTARLFVALVAEDPKGVREAGAKLLGDPRPDTAAMGASANGWADFLEGKLDDALDQQRQQLERIQTHAGPHEIVGAILSYANELRRLGRKHPDPALLKVAAGALANATLLRPAARANAKGLLLVASVDDPKTVKADLLKVIAEADKIAEEAPGRAVRESARLTVIGLVRMAKGDAEAAKLWRETPHADRGTRDAAALEAALALDATGASDEARDAYDRAAGPFGAYSPLAKRIAQIRLAELYRKLGEADHAAQEDALIARAWKNVDPAVIERIKKL